jgi:penicillin-binding protein 1C
MTRWKRRLRLALRAGVLVLLALTVGAGVYVVAFPYPVARLEPQRATSLVLVDRRGEVLRVLPLDGGGRAAWVTLDRIAPELIRATLVGEDHRFWRHAGVDGVAVVRAVGSAARHGRLVSGASTVTMQLVRLAEPHPRTLAGKVGEMLDALRLERALPKPAILEQYLNRAYYGNGAFGVEAAARRYFCKPAAALSTGEATLLAVLPRAPRGYDPLRHLPVALARRAQVLERMEAGGWLTLEERRRAEAEPLAFAPACAPDQPARLAPHFTDWVLAQLPDERRARGGVVTTTLDLPLQRRLEIAVRDHLTERGEIAWQAGVVVVDPATGAVRAMVGSAGYDGPGGQVNITTTARHPGSALKPFVYAAAIQAGDTPATLAVDARGAVAGYQPHKRMHEHGVARYREALAGSYNLAAVDVIGRVGVPVLLEDLRRAGLGPLGGTAQDYGFDLALGSARVRLVDLAAAYGFLVQGGRVARATGLADSKGAPPVRLFSPEASWLVMDMLADPAARRASFGAELPLDLPFPVAAKTGTSSGFADTLAVGATREAVAAAWVGAFDGSGTKGTLAMWSAAPLVRAALLAVADQRGEPLTLPPAPDRIVAHDVCRVTGLAPGPSCLPKRERFIAGHEPAGACPGHQRESGANPTTASSARRRPYRSSSR